ncbi:MAG: acyl-CoA synthetase [Betaproteobacteria bacterium]
MRGQIDVRGHPMPRWRSQRERGSPALMAFVAGVALRVGRPAAATLLPVICAYFMLFSRHARRASRGYLTRALGRPAGWRDMYRQFHCFATTILDRVLWLAGRVDEYAIEMTGVEALDDALREGRGCLLVGAHFGSFELLRVLATTRPGMRVRALMHPHNDRKLAGVLGRDVAVRTDPIIELGRPETMLEVRDALAGGAIVAMLADRSPTDADMAPCPFLGAPADFPRGPFKLAAVLGAPIVLFRATWHGGRRYRIAFEAFGTVPSGARGDVDPACARYAIWLDNACRASPENWFNFYDFWASAADRNREKQPS